MLHACGCAQIVGVGSKVSQEAYLLHKCTTCSRKVPCWCVCYLTHDVPCAIYGYQIKTRHAQHAMYTMARCMWVVAWQEIVRSPHNVHDSKAVGPA